MDYVITSEDNYYMWDRYNKYLIYLEGNLVGQF